MGDFNIEFEEGGVGPTRLCKLDFSNVGELHQAVKSAGDLSNNQLGQIIQKHYDGMAPLQRYSFLLTCGFTDDGLRSCNFDAQMPITYSRLPLEDLTKLYRQIFVGK